MFRLGVESFVISVVESVVDSVIELVVDSVVNSVVDSVDCGVEVGSKVASSEKDLRTTASKPRNLKLLVMTIDLEKNIFINSLRHLRQLQFFLVIERSLKPFQ